MRICLFSYRFFPSVGGVEQVNASLASAWTAKGHPVTLVTTTPLGDGDADLDRSFTYPIIRLSSHDSKRQWKQVLDQSDLVISSGASLTYFRSWMLSRKPLIHIHHLFWGMEQEVIDGTPLDRLRWRARHWLRLQLLRRSAGNIYVSRWMLNRVGVPGEVIHNPVASMFLPMPDVPIAADIGFFGRIVGEKGVNDLLDALHLCNTRGHRFTVSLWGEGNKKEEYQQQAIRLQLADQVQFRPVVRGEELVRAMNSVRIVAVPSKWPEPMGLVAIEAMACGKCVIGSSEGGLGEILQGVCPTYPNHDVGQLADRLIQALTSTPYRQEIEQAALRHSRNFELGKIADDYLNYFQRILKH
jgi:glycosyltransferase involved in cell wall biosynthesis